MILGVANDDSKILLKLFSFLRLWISLKLEEDLFDLGDLLPERSGIPACVFKKELLRLLASFTIGLVLAALLLLRSIVLALSRMLLGDVATQALGLWELAAAVGA